MTPRSDFVPDWLEKRARLTPDRVGLVDNASRAETTFAEWNARASRTAALLRRLGIRRGDLVAVYADNEPAYLDLLFACNKLGAVLHNLSWRLTAYELREIVVAAQPRALVYGRDRATGADELREALPVGAGVIAMGEPASREDAPLADREREPDTLGAPPDLHPDDPWGIFYTGGTTGTPKGAVMTYGNMAWNSINTITSWGITAAHSAALQLPLFHIGGPNIFAVPLVHVGGRTILCSGFDVVETFDLIDRGEITHYVGVPAMYVMLQQHERWESSDFSRLELVISGGAPCPLPIMERFWERGVDFKLGYGLTEAAGNNFWLPPKEVRRKPGSVGYPLFHIDVQIIHEDGQACAEDEVGELLIRGPHVMAGYWQCPDATADVIRDGWLHTGDLARRDADGAVTIVGRSKEMFISGGENVYPAEVESVIHAHPAVVEAALVSVSHDLWGEVGHAFVVRNAARTFDEAELLAFLAGRLGKYKLPVAITFVESLPRTAIGKIDKTRLVHQSGGPHTTPPPKP